jgi:hypothetical protein
MKQMTIFPGTPERDLMRGEATMTKRVMVVVLLYWILSSAAGWAQTVCSSNAKTLPLYCQVPVATGAVFKGAGNPGQAFNAAFATQLGQLPLLSSGSGIVLTFDKTTASYLPSQNLGPILTDRAQTVGKHKLLLAFAYQRFRFNAVDGTNLSTAPFVFSASPLGATGVGVNRCTPTGTANIICLQQNDKISMKLDQYVALATFGLDQKTDVSVIIPFARVSLGVSELGTQYFISASGQSQGTAPLNSYTPGTASGIGDMLVNVKRLFWSGENSNLAAGLLVRFPTGDALNYLGSGAYGFDPYAVFSYQRGRFSPHARLGYQFNTTTELLPPPSGSGGNGSLPGGFQYDAGADFVLFRKVPTTVAGDMLGYYVVNSPYLQLINVDIPGNPSAPSLSPFNQSYNSIQFSIGAKVKPWKNLILYGNVLFQANNVGLRSSPVPLLGISYTF